MQVYGENVSLAAVVASSKGEWEEDSDDNSVDTTLTDEELEVALVNEEGEWTRDVRKPFHSLWKPFHTYVHLYKR